MVGRRCSSPCLAASLVECRGCNRADFAQRLLRWRDQGYMAVDGKVVDIGRQTDAALSRLAAGTPLEHSGLDAETDNGNGSLMRSLPMALFVPEDAYELVQVAHEQSAVTHAHPRSQMCCALYGLWARGEMARDPDSLAWAISQLRTIYRECPLHAEALEKHLLPALSTPPQGTGNVVDSFCSAFFSCMETPYKRIVKKAVSFGHDTNTTACLAGGIARLRYRLDGMPAHWLGLVRARASGVPVSFIRSIDRKHAERYCNLVTNR